MAFRGSSGGGGGGGGDVALEPGVPTKSVEIGDLFEQGTSGKYADSDHQHAFSGPAPGSAQPLAATSSDSDANDRAPARSRHTHAHTAEMHGPGGHADLSGLFPSYTAADERYAQLLHGAQHGRGGVDPLTGVFVPFDLIDAKGDLLVGHGNDQLVRVPGGASGTFFQADPTQPGGVKWGTLPGVQSYDPSSFAFRKATNPDGIDLSYGTPGVAQTAQTTTTITLLPMRVFGSGFLYTFAANTVLDLNRPASGTRSDSIVLRIDNANGGPGSATIALKQGTSTAFPPIAFGDLSASDTAVYEVELYRLTTPAGTGAVTVSDVRPIAKGVDGRDGTRVKLAEFENLANMPTFSDIPQTLRHLELEAIVRNVPNAAQYFVQAKMSPGTHQWDAQFLEGYGASATAARGLDQATIYANVPATTASNPTGANTATVTLYEYAQNVQRSARMVITGGEGDFPRITIGSWVNHSPSIITGIDLTKDGAANKALPAGVPNRFTLYGLR